MTEPRRILHGRVSLALHELRPGDDAGRLLLLHELGSSSAAWQGVAGWPGTGAVQGLDLAGHGASGARPGAAYTPELFAADVDAALAVLGPCRLVGAGLGAYVALLLAGARPNLVPAALLLPGRGLAGGGDEPDEDDHPAAIDAPPDTSAGTGGHDPAVLACARDVRPPDYAGEFARAASLLLLVEDGAPMPGWWRAARAEAPARVTGSLADGLAALAASA